MPAPRAVSAHRFKLAAAVLDGYGSKKIATVLRRQPEISMSPDRHSSGATRIEADLSSTEERELMRRASTCLAVLALAAAALALPSFASAAPTVTLKAIAVPTPKPGGGNWPGPGNIY